MGKRIIHCGPSGAGLGAKICNNLVLGVEQIVVAEAMLLGQKLGLDPAVLAGVINSSTGGCWASSVNNPVPSALPDKSPPCERDYEGGFATALMLKVLVMLITSINKPHICLTGHGTRNKYRNKLWKSSTAWRGGRKTLCRSCEDSTRASSKGFFFRISISSYRCANRQASAFGRGLVNVKLTPGNDSSCGGLERDRAIKEHLSITEVHFRTKCNVPSLSMLFWRTNDFPVENDERALLKPLLPNQQFLLHPTVTLLIDDYILTRAMMMTNWCKFTEGLLALQYNISIDY